MRITGQPVIDADLVHFYISCRFGTMGSGVSDFPAAGRFSTDPVSDSGAFHDGSYYAGFVECQQKRFQLAILVDFTHGDVSAAHLGRRSTVI